MSSIMSGYETCFKVLDKDNATDFSASNTFFNFDKFRNLKDAKKSHTFINQLTNTINFTNFIESRSIGKTDQDK